MNHFKSLRDSKRNHVNFDYDKWEDLETLVKFMSVSWDAEYKNVVDWTSDEQREQYFLNKKGHIEEYETGWNFKSLEVFKPNLNRHIGSIRTEVPYEAILNYNYLMVEMYRQPVVGGGEDRREIFYYFITSFNKIAPNTTEVFLELDTWTTFKNSVKINGIKLERGHYPHATTTATDYLKDPLNNHYGITAYEPELPEVKPLVSHEKLISFQKNSPRICIATTANLTDRDAFWLNVKNTQNINKGSNRPTPENNWWLETREVGDNGNAPVAAVSGQQVNSNTLGVQVYSIAPNDFTGFINAVRNKYPQFLKTIKGVYVLDSSLIKETTNTISFSNYAFKIVEQQNDYSIIETLSMNKNLFDYDSANADFAKLYTRQFATIEVSDLSGKIAEISVEDIAKSLDFYSRASSMFPFLKLEAFINGVGGKDKKTYAVKPWRDKTATTFGSSWEEYMFNLDIPVYGVYAEATEYNGPSAQISAYREINSENTYYNNDNRANARDRDNSLDSISRTYLNENNASITSFNNAKTHIQRVFSNDSAEISTLYSNRISDISRTLNNANDEFITTRGNLGTSFTIDITNANREFNNVGDNIISNNTIAGLNIEYSQDEYIMRNHNIYRFQNAVSTEEVNMFNSRKEITKTLTFGNLYQATYLGELGLTINGFTTMSNIAGSALAGDPGGAFSSGISGLIQDRNIKETYTINGTVLVNTQRLIDGTTISYNTSGEDTTPQDIDLIETGNNTFSGETILTSYNVAGVTQAYAGRSLSALSTTMNLKREQWAHQVERSINYGVWNINSKLTRDTNIAEVKFLKNTSDRNFNADKSIAEYAKIIGDNSNELELSNAERNNTVDRAISLADRNTGNANTSRTRNADSNISSATRNVERDNILRNRNVDNNITNNSFNTLNRNINETFNTGLKNTSYDYFNKVSEEPKLYGEFSGNAWNDSWGLRGLDVRVKRCSKATEQRASELFHKYGYRTDSLWVKNPKLSLMNKFTYWEGEDIWLVGNSINETNKQIIRDIFRHGTTVWRSPDEVANVDINSNILI